MTRCVLSTKDLIIGYSSPFPKAITAPISVELYAGELVCLLGPNGAGKSTLLRTLAGLQPALEGQIFLREEDLHRLNPQERARRLAIVLTDRVEIDNFSVYALVALGRHPYTDWTGKLTWRDEEVIRWAIQATGTVELARRSVSELSDGERQKVMIARALAQEPDILILDEPTAFLDLPRRVDIMRLLRNLAHETRCSVLLSTHDLDLALRSADRIWLLPSGGPLKAGIPEDLVLDGTFEATFQSEGVVFDKNTGSFKIHRSWIGQIGLIGEGLPTFWTARALEREGFEVIRSGNPLPLQVEIMVQNGNIRWRSRCYETHHEHSTLGELVAFMKGFSS